MTRNGLPTFFILGAAKCGTTWLYHYLQGHPDVCMSRPKEPLFFEAEYERGEKYYRDTYFAHWRGEPIIGEARHRNLYLPYVPQRIHELVPDARLIVIVRDPVERAVSHWWHWYVRKREPLPFDKAVRANFRRLEGSPMPEEDLPAFWARKLQAEGKDPYRTYVDSGYYYEQIQRYRNLFPDDRIKILFLRDVSEQPVAVGTEVFKFLGAQTGYTPPAPEPRNTANSFIARRLNQFLNDRGVREVLPSPIPDYLSSAWRVVLSIANKVGPRKKAGVTDNIRDDLRRHYDPHNRALSSLTGRDLSNWL